MTIKAAGFSGSRNIITCSEAISDFSFSGSFNSATAKFPTVAFRPQESQTLQLGRCTLKNVSDLYA